MHQLPHQRHWSHLYQRRRTCSITSARFGSPNNSKLATTAAGAAITTSTHTAFEMPPTASPTAAANIWRSRCANAALAWWLQVRSPGHSHPANVGGR